MYNLPFRYVLFHYMGQGGRWRKGREWGRRGRGRGWGYIRNIRNITEDCAYAEDIGNQPLREPMPKRGREGGTVKGVGGLVMECGEGVA